MLRAFCRRTVPQHHPLLSFQRHFFMRLALFSTLTSGILSFFRANTQPTWKLKQEEDLRSAADRNLSLAFRDKLIGLTDMKRIDEYLDHILIPRPVGCRNIRKVSIFIKQVLERLNYKVDFLEFTLSDLLVSRERKRLKFRNIVATLNPLAPRTLVLACHYDSKTFDKLPFVGATDSAVPCALLLDVAVTLEPYLRNSPTFSDVTLQLIFFDGEEAFGEWSPTDSLYGSRWLAELWSNVSYPQPFNEFGTKELDRIDVFVLLDLLGAVHPKVPNFRQVNYQPVYDLFANIEQSLLAEKKLNEPRHTMFEGDIIYGSVDDDHAPFHRNGVKIAHIVAAPFPKGWHTMEDNRDSLHKPTIENWSTIIRLFAASYLNLTDVKNSDKKIGLDTP